MKNITIGFSKPRDFKIHAWIIMKLDHAPYDHAYLKFHSDSLERDIIYQAVGKGVQFIGLTLFKTKTQPVEEYKIDVDDDKYTSMMQFCVDNAGVSYGFLQILGVACVKIMARFGKSIKNPFDKGLQNEFCSEIVARCLMEADPKQFNMDPASISPKQLNSLIKGIQAQRIL